MDTGGIIRRVLFEYLSIKYANYSISYASTRMWVGEYLVWTIHVKYSGRGYILIQYLRAIIYLHTRNSGNPCLSICCVWYWIFETPCWVRMLIFIIFLKYLHYSEQSDRTLFRYLTQEFQFDVWCVMACILIICCNILAKRSGREL